jgi:molybdopterin biosynthesis enzyme MoaB
VYEDLSGPAVLQFFQEAIKSPWTAQYVVIPDEQPVIEATLKDLVRVVLSFPAVLLRLSDVVGCPVPVCIVAAADGQVLFVCVCVCCDSSNSGGSRALSRSLRCHMHRAFCASHMTPPPGLKANAHTLHCTPMQTQADHQGCCLVVTTGGTGPAPRDVTPEATEAVCSRMLPGYGEQMRAISLKYVPTAVLSRQTAGEACGVRQQLRKRGVLHTAAAVLRCAAGSCSLQGNYGVLWWT